MVVFSNTNGENTAAPLKHRFLQFQPLSAILQTQIYTYTPSWSFQCLITFARREEQEMPHFPSDGWGRLMGVVVRMMRSGYE